MWRENENTSKEKLSAIGTLFLETAMDDDRHLVFEALHVLADGLPGRLFAMLHPADPAVEADGDGRHLQANPGRTWRFIHDVADGTIRACVSGMPECPGIVLA